MIIRCPQCEYSRTISESKVPASAELATCPKCKHRFRFRTQRKPEAQDIVPDALERSAPSDRSDRMVRPDFANVAHSQPPLDAPPYGTATPEPLLAPPDRTADEPDMPDPTAGMPEEKSRHEHSAALEKASEALFARLERGSLSRPSRPCAGSVPSPRHTPDSMPGSMKAAPPAYPDHPDHTDNPEERVERDLRLLRETPDERPTRNLGSLLDDPEMEEGEHAPLEEPPLLAPPADAGYDDYIDEEQSESAIPWENPARHGWIRGFMNTLHGVMFRGPEFFQGFSPHGSLGPGYLFFLIMGYATILGGLLWSQALAALLPGAVQGLSSRIALPTLLLLAPIALGLMLLFVSGCVRLILLVCDPQRSDFPLIYKVVSYSMAPFVLSIVPFVGPVLGAAWFVAALVTGCRHALGLSWNLAVLAPLPPAIMLLGGLVWYFL